MTGEHKKDIRDRILEIITGLPTSQVHELFDLMNFPEIAQDERVLLAKSTLIDHLNRNRRERARRLFMMLFEPFLTGDPMVLRSDSLLPGLVHRVDVSALWFGLSKNAFEETAQAAQRQLDGLAKAMLLDQALRTAEAEELQNDMRLHAISFLKDVLKSESAVETFLSALNRRRVNEAKNRVIYFGDVYRLERPYLSFIYEYLHVWRELARETRPALAMMERRPGGVAATDPLAQQLAEAVTRVQEALSGPAVRRQLFILTPLAALHTAQRFDVAGTYLRYIDLDGLPGAPIVESLVRYVAIALADSAAIMAGSLRLRSRVPGASIRMSQRERSQLESDLARVSELFAAVELSGLLETRATAPTIKGHWQRFARMLMIEILPVQLQRFTVAVLARNARTLDHDDTLWLTKFLWSWDGLARRIDPDQPLLTKWREGILMDIRAALERAMKFEANETAADRLDHFMRLNHFLKIFQERISRYVTVSSRSVAVLARHCLENPQAIGRDEEEFLNDFLQMAEEEVARSRTWKSPELVDLLDLAKATGFYPRLAAPVASR